MVFIGRKQNAESGDQIKKNYQLLNQNVRWMYEEEFA